MIIHSNTTTELINYDYRESFYQVSFLFATDFLVQEDKRDLWGRDHQFSETSTRTCTALSLDLSLFSTW